MTDDDKLLKNSLKVRNKGRIKYSLEQGLIFGIITFIAGTIFNLDEKSFTEIYFSLRGLLTLGISIIVGFTFYWTIMWKLNERTIKKNGELKEKSN